MAAKKLSQAIRDVRVTSRRLNQYFECVDLAELFTPP